jgi:tRNA 5-methylaminomethyl-2-thiouridine biosynthesis bifunctional protein
VTEIAGAPTLHPAAIHLRTYCAAQASWTVLDTGFGQGRTFAEVRQCWRSQSPRPPMLHYVGVLSLEQALALQAAHQKPGNDALPRQADLADLCFGLGEGFHRFLLDDGALSLTLCVGALPAMLAQQEMQADTIVADASAALWDKWLIKALARHCKRGTSLHFDAAPPVQAALLEAAGFVLQPPGVGRAAYAVFNPRWTLRNSRRPQATARYTPGTCAVIGAGIAGASVAHALAVRGWTVAVHDAHPHPAGGASGLPVGLVVPHHSSDDSPRSRMSRVGTRLMLQHAARLHKGTDWNPSGVLELHPEASELDEVEAEVRSPSPSPGPAQAWARAMTSGELSGLWHPYAAWIKPGQLVAQWLGHPGIQFHGNSRIASLERSGGNWLLRDAQGRPAGRADTVVFANAFACQSLLQRLNAEQAGAISWVPDLWNKIEALQVLHGTLSLGLCPSAIPVDWPAFPVNGHGSFVSGVPGEQGLRWFAGSTFRADANALFDVAQEQATNLAKLQVLLPQVANTLATQFESRQTQTWQGRRCVTHDRLPLVGPLEEGPAPTLWLSAGMGARGLSFSALCAELIAAWMGGEPLPVENQLARSLSTLRPRRQRTTQGGSTQGALDSRQV